MRASELVSTGGTWGAVLFENSGVRVPPGFTWSFSFEFEDVTRDFGSSAVSLSVDWVPLDGARWHAIDGRAASSSRFATPIESSVCFFEHYRYDAVQLRIVAQTGSDVVVSAQLRGDIDGLGLDQIDVEARLRFTGVRVRLERPPRSVAAARRKLRQFTDVEGLVGSTSGQGFKFTVAD